ncbi:PQQ-binding-like beta-propeller repeat protein [bacterium]|nr:PQQ-binding-like beta-propeller repeat protein [bacterium]
MNADHCCRRWICVACWFASLLLVTSHCAAVSIASPYDVPEQPDAWPRGLAVVLGIESNAFRAAALALAHERDVLVFCQTPSAAAADEMRNAADAAGMLGTRVFVAHGPLARLGLADNLAGEIVAPPCVTQDVAEAELLRVLHPEGTAVIGDRTIVKPFPEGIDAWSHPHHGPDNNPLSRDRQARVPYMTQFLGFPLFSPMPEVTVAAGGRIFRAHGHIAMRRNQNVVLNTLFCVNGYNGQIIWRRPLHKGFMIHRNTIIATPDALFLGDDVSCKLIDARTGAPTREIAIPPGISDGPVWKWMALEGGVLYALAGAAEVQVDTLASTNLGIGQWPWGMWKGHDYKDPARNFGFGRTFAAFDTTTLKLLWHRREDDYIDSRGVCMRNGRIYYYAPRQYIACLDVRTRTQLWKRADEEILGAIGPDRRAQNPREGFATQTYVKCDDDCLFFAGPQRSNIVALATRDGSLLWQQRDGNRLLVLRDDGIYYAGAGRGAKMDYQGNELEVLPGRRSCTRATGSIDSLFYRAPEGTAHIVIDGGTIRTQHIAPMRPSCQDGVIIAGGMLYWSPWMCACWLSLYGSVGAGPAGAFDFHPGPASPEMLADSAALSSVKAFPDDDSGSYLPDAARAGEAGVASTPFTGLCARAWSFQALHSGRPTPPLAAVGLVFIGDEHGAVHAIDAASGTSVWKRFTGGAIFAAPVLSAGRLFVGSADGCVYAFEAASGRPLWRFRVGPAGRMIPVYGTLMSTWPVSGGVVAKDGVVYAAAGIAHYDGTYVCALDAATGAVKWYNDSSGVMSEEFRNGVSLQGPLRIEDGSLCFEGGSVCPTARFDLATGEFINTLPPRFGSLHPTAYAAYYPWYDQYVSLDHTFDDGTTLDYEALYDGSYHAPLSLLKPITLAPGQTMGSRLVWWTQASKREIIWQDKRKARYNGLVVANGAVIGAGQAGPLDNGEPFIAACRIADGQTLWEQPLPAPAVKGGLAAGDDGRLYMSLSNGQLLAFEPERRRLSGTVGDLR